MSIQRVNLIESFKQEKYITQQVLSFFKKPLLENPFFINKEYLIQNATITKFNNEKWEMRPDIFCLDIYEMPNLWPVVLLVNDISSYFNFTASQFSNGIITPTYESIVYVVNAAV